MVGDSASLRTAEESADAIDEVHDLVCPLGASLTPRPVPTSAARCKQRITTRALPRLCHALELDNTVPADLLLRLDTAPRTAPR